MRRSLLQRSAALVLIGLWAAPGAGGLVVGIHVAEHHRAHEQDSRHHTSRVEELAAAAAHGHHHSAAVPKHDHPAAFDSASDLRWSPTVAAVNRVKESAPTWREGRKVTGTRHRPGSADLLFYAHCSLLL